MTDQERKAYYEDKQGRKLERFKELAQKNQEESKAVYEHGQRIADAIPFGQPILVGHHSEKRHRRDLERIQNSMDKSIELKNKAEHYEKKAENIENPNTISSDDPEAIIKLKEKLERLEKQRDTIKAYNTSCRKGKPDISLLDEDLKREIKTIQEVTPYNSEKGEFPSYVLTNLGSNIRRIKERIEYLGRIEKVGEVEEVKNSIKLSIDKIENRVKLHFPGKPSPEIIAKLKSNGFKWSPTNMCWQRMISDYAIQLARDIQGESV